MKISRKIQN